MTAGRRQVNGADLARELYEARLTALARGGMLFSVLDRAFQALDTRRPMLFDHMQGDRSLNAALLPGNRVSLCDINFTEPSFLRTLDEVRADPGSLAGVAKKVAPVPECGNCPALAICGGIHGLRRRCRGVVSAVRQDDRTDDGTAEACMGEARRHIPVAERRARLGVRHRLAGAARAACPEEAARALVALHGTDPATVYLAIGARLSDPAKTVPDTERALYEDRSLVRMHGMRHTVFVFPAELTAVVHASTGLAVAARERAALVKDMARAGAPDRAWLAEVEESTLAALGRRGRATAAELAADEPRLREQFVYAAGKSYEGVHTVSTRLLRVLGVEGKVVRDRPLGSWTSSQFRWALAPAHPELDPAEARAALLRHWLAACGPATEADLKWWTGWRVTDVRRALAAIGAQQVSLDEGTAYVADGDADPVAGPGEPWAALLPALDPTAMAWQHRDWFLTPDLRASLFDRSGNVGPTVWWDGRVVGGWAQRPDGEIVWRVLDRRDMGREAEAAIAAEAERLRGWVGTTRVTPRFRTPLERELAT